MSVTKALTKHYENICLHTRRQNKPNQTQFQNHHLSNFLAFRILLGAGRRNDGRLEVLSFLGGFGILLGKEVRGDMECYSERWFLIIDKAKIVMHLSTCMVKESYHDLPCPHLDYLTGTIAKPGLDIREGPKICEVAQKRRDEGLYRKN